MLAAPTTARGPWELTFQSAELSGRLLPLPPCAPSWLSCTRPLPAPSLGLSNFSDLFSPPFPLRQLFLDVNECHMKSAIKKGKWKGVLLMWSLAAQSRPFTCQALRPSSPSENPQSWALLWNRRPWQCQDEVKAWQLGAKCTEVVCYSQNLNLEIWKGPCHHSAQLHSLCRCGRSCLENMKTACLSHKMNWSCWQLRIRTLGSEDRAFSTLLSPGCDTIQGSTREKYKSSVTLPNMFNHF